MIFYEVIRIYKSNRRKLYEGDNRARAEAAFEQEWRKIHSGDLLLYADGVQEQACHCGYNRTRW